MEVSVSVSTLCRLYMYIGPYIHPTSWQYVVYRHLLTDWHTYVLADTPTYWRTHLYTDMYVTCVSIHLHTYSILTVCHTSYSQYHVYCQYIGPWVLHSLSYMWHILTDTVVYILSCDTCTHCMSTSVYCHTTPYRVYRYTVSICHM